MKTCYPSPTDKRAYGKALGDELLTRRGKRRYYSLKDIREAAKRLDFPPDCTCWGYALYSSPEDFEQHHIATGEACDYAAMKAEMFAAMTDGSSTSWFDVNMSWLEWPDVDFSGIFSFFDA